MKINWKFWMVYIGIGIFIPFASIALKLFDSLFFEVDIINDIHYGYMVQNSLVLWVILYFVLSMYYKKEK